MFDRFAAFLKQLQESTDVTKLVDCVWDILGNDPRFRNELIKRINSAPEVSGLQTPVSTPHTTLGHDFEVTSPEVELPVHLQGPTEPNGPDETTMSTNPMGLSPLHDSGKSDRKPISNESASRKRRRARKQDADCDRTWNASDNCPSPSASIATNAEHENGGAKEKVQSLVPDPSRSTKRRCARKESLNEERENTLAQPTVLPTVITERRSRGPGKKQTDPAPDFGEERFLHVDETLRREISESTDLGGLEESWKLVDAIQGQAIEPLRIERSDPKIRQLQCKMDYCDSLEMRSKSLSTRARIEWRFYMVQLMAEYQISKAENNSGTRSHNITESFQRTLFPDKPREKAKGSWDYYCRVGDPLLQAVRRFGWGVLVFPLGKVNKKSLHILKRPYIDDFLDYIEKCHPSLKTKICNLSYALPKLLTFGLPPAGLQFCKMPFEELTSVDRECFNRLFPLPAGVTAQGLPDLEHVTEVAPWPSEPTTDVSEEFQPDCLNEPPLEFDEPVSQASDSSGLTWNALGSGLMRDSLTRCKEAGIGTDFW